MHAAFVQKVNTFFIHSRMYCFSAIARGVKRSDTLLEICSCAQGTTGPIEGGSEC